MDEVRSHELASQKHTSSALDTSALGTADESVPARQVVPRRGHTKSRRGCATCKRRRVKCPEDRPACASCERLGLSCQYEDAMVQPSAPLQSSGGQFAMHDFRLFHHFLLHAYPPLPLHGKPIWDGVCQISHEFDFLIHAMLGLSASHLGLCTSSDAYRTQALSHRTTAIARVNAALASGPSSSVRGDALYAALMVLAFQSSYMDDGMLEIIPTLRGCMMMLGLASTGLSLFRRFTVADHQETVCQLIQSNPDGDHNPPDLESGLASFRAIRPLCRTGLEIGYFNTVEKIIIAASHSVAICMSMLSQYLLVSVCLTREAFFEGYHIFSQATHGEFMAFGSAENHVAQLLMIHFFVVEYVVALKMMPSVLDSMRFKAGVIQAWVSRIDRGLPDEYREYLVWPKEFMEVEVPITNAL